MNKKLTVKRVVFFCVISFLPFWVIVPALNSAYGGMIYTVEEAGTAVYALVALGMFIPAIAHLLTRLITKEGFENSYLEPNVKGKGRYYAAAIVVKLIETAVIMLLLCKVFLGEFSLSELFLSENISSKLAMVFLQLAVSIILFFPGFGEEWGWRGYLGPKLKELIGMPASIVVGGIIWGLWHAPLTIAGNNFGTDYSYYPWVGIGLMCASCIVFNAFLTWLTERTKSIYPASFCHMIHNNLAAELLLMMLISEAGQEALSNNPGYTGISAFLVSLPVIAVTGVVGFVLVMKKRNF